MIELGEFHLLRPWFLALLPVGLALVWLLHYSRTSDERMVDARLRDYVVIGRHKRSRWWRNALLAGIVFIGSLALSGPGWKTTEVPAQRNANPTFILLDLSLSMAAQDVQPNRYKRAIFAIRDLLANNPQSAPFALITYAGSAWQVTPLSFDLATIENFLDALDPRLLPEGGSNPLSALELVADSIRTDKDDQKADPPPQATIVLISDDLSTHKQQIITWINNQGWHLALIAAGKKNGVPVATDDGNLLRDNSGKIQLASYHPQSFIDIARATGATLASIDNTLGTVKGLRLEHTNVSEETIKREQLADQGYVFVLLLLPLALLAMRKGMFAIALIVGLSTPSPARAFSWQDLWQTKDNQALQAIQNGEYQKAEQLAGDPLIRGGAEYKQGDYEAALISFSKVETSTGKYNAGNAAFQLGDYAQAIALYQQALQKQPQEQLREDIEYNLKLAEQNRNQQPQDSQNQNEQNQDQQNQDEQQGDNQQQQQQQSGEQSQQQQQQQQSGEQQQKSSEQNQPQRAGEQQSKEGEASDDESNQSAQNQPTQQAEQSDNTPDTEQSPTFAETQNSPEENNGDASSDSQAQAFQELDTSSKVLINRVNDNPAELLRRMFLLQQQRRGKDPSNQESNL